MMQLRNARQEVDLVLEGYTISTPVGVLARVGECFIMRNQAGAHLAIPADTDPKQLLRVWQAFKMTTEQ